MKCPNCLELLFKFVDANNRYVYSCTRVEKECHSRILYALDTKVDIIYYFVININNITYDLAGAQGINYTNLWWNDHKMTIPFHHFELSDEFHIQVRNYVEKLVKLKNFY